MDRQTLRVCRPLLWSLYFHWSYILKDIEKLFYWFIPLFIVEFVFTGMVSGFLSEIVKAAGGKDSKLSWLLTATEMTPIQALGYFTALKSWLSLITQFVVGVWLFFSARKNGAKPVLWGLFGCMTGVLAIAIYYLALITESQRNGSPSKI